MGAMDYRPLIDAAKGRNYEAVPWRYSPRDVILYNISCGCKREELQYVFENHPHFGPLPTWPVASVHRAHVPFADLLPTFDPRLLLHGEHFLLLHKPLPPEGDFVVMPSLVDMVDKGKAALISTKATIIDAATDQVYAENELTIFARGSGGFGPTSSVPRRADVIALNQPPDTPSDAVVEERTSPEQAALYRLNGDYNPLHIDPEFSGQGGFDVPILHGLCTYALSTKHVLQALGHDNPANLRWVKARFSGHVFPGETLETRMWAVSAIKVIFQARVVERNSLVVSNAAVEFQPGVLDSQERERAAL